ncbi:MAG TPA: DUF998 domain-containing protein, partial [Leifsonia sp.]
RSLLGYGMVAGPFYIVASLVEAISRSGFNLAQDDWSLLALGAFGWIHVTVLILTGLMVIAAAVGLFRELRSQGDRTLAAWLLGGFGAGMVGAGIFPADPANGFPPGTASGATSSISWHGALHLAFGGLGFIAFTVACIVIAIRFQRADEKGWFAFSLTTGILFLASFIGIASGRPTTLTVLAFTAGVILAFAWLFLFSRYLYRLIAARRH